MTLRLFELERNDVQGAAAAYREIVLSETRLERVRDAASILLQLQDDPTKLERHLDQIAREPEVRRALTNLRGAEVTR